MSVEQEARLRGILPQLVLADQFVYQNGLQHRDLKPSNVLMNASGHVKLLDFGLATGANPVELLQATQPQMAKQNELAPSAASQVPRFPR